MPGVFLPLVLICYTIDVNIALMLVNIVVLRVLAVA